MEVFRQKPKSVCRIQADTFLVIREADPMSEEGEVNFVFDFSSR